MPSRNEGMAKTWIEFATIALRAAPKDISFAERGQILKRAGILWRQGERSLDAARAAATGGVKASLRRTPVERPQRGVRRRQENPEMLAVVKLILAGVGGYLLGTINPITLGAASLEPMTQAQRVTQVGMNLLPHVIAVLAAYYYAGGWLAVPSYGAGAVVGTGMTLVRSDLPGGGGIPLGGMARLGPNTLQVAGDLV